VGRLRLRAAAAILPAFLGACAAPDTPPSVAADVPGAVLALLEPDTVRSAAVARGVRYHYLWSVRGPWAVHVVESHLGRCELALDVLQAEARQEGGTGHERVTSMVHRNGPSVLTAVNADFFTPEGTTVGTEMVSGAVTAARERPALAWRAGADPWIGEARIRADQLHLGWVVPIGSGDAHTEAVGGFPELLAEGTRVGDLGVGERPAFAATRHPRTAVGYDPLTRRLWLVVVDGRQSPHSSGMTLPELAALLEALGAVEAINLDGGGSSVMVVHGRVVNRPADAAGERPVVNALALRHEPAGCTPGGRR
jgi:hypothetical protein